MKKLVLALFFLFFSVVNTTYADELILGFYTFAVKADLDMISNSSFKYLMPYGTEGYKKVEFLDDYLNHAEKKGINIIFSLKDIYKESRWYPKIKWCPTDEESKLLECVVKRFRDNESIYGWYLADEPTHTLGNNKSAKLKRNSTIIRELSSKPIFVDDFPIPMGKLWGSLSNLSDIFMTNVYPVPEKPLSDIYGAVKELTVSYGKPVIAVVQTHGKYQYPFYKRDEVTGRPPTYQEIRVMSYLGLIAGARGIIYYSFFDIKKLPDFRQRWSFLKRLGEELTKDFKIISSKEKTSKNYKLNKDDEVYAILRHYNDKDYLIAVNSTHLDKLITISQPLKKSFLRKIELAPFDVKIEILKKH